jgi:tetratricopeptide (TPR) repeat protein
VLRRKRTFDRTETLAGADKARARGHRKKAIALYRQVLDVHPDDLTVHGKIAPLLAGSGERSGALASFRAASAGHERAGFPDRALSVLSQAAELFPEEEPLWEDLVRIQLARGRRADAVAALARGGARLLALRSTAAAERVLRRAGGIEPWHPGATRLLARTFAAAGRRADALRLLDGLAVRTLGVERRRARGLALRLAPTPLNLWRWLRAVLTGR